MRLHQTCLCPECTEVFAYTRNNICPNCGNRLNNFLLSSFLNSREDISEWIKRKENYHVKDDPNRSVCSNTKLDHLSTDDPSKTIEYTPEPSKEHNRVEVSKPSRGIVKAFSSFFSTSIRGYRNFNGVLDGLDKYGKQFQRKSGIFKRVQRINADTPRSVLSER